MTKKIRMHCCNKMAHFIEEGKLPIRYNPKFRKYSLLLLGQNWRKGPFAVQMIFFCPWCGAKLPTSLEEVYWDTIENELKLDPDSFHAFDFLEDPRIPEEFKTDEWWKKRGL